MAAVDAYSTRLHESMGSGRLHNFCILVDVGSVDIDAVDEQGQTPLMAACYLTTNKAVTLSMVRKLLQSGADVNKTDGQGQTVLHHAVSQQKLPIMQLLLDTNKAKLITQDVEGNTPLHLAVKVEDCQIVRALVVYMTTYQVSSEVINKAGLTPLTLACKQGRVDIARYLSAVAHHSPMKRDFQKQLTGREWLEMVLFIPYALDPFNCLTSQLRYLRPKPTDYVLKSSQQHCISHDWHKTIDFGMRTLLGRPQSSPEISRSSPDSVIVQRPQTSPCLPRRVSQADKCQSVQKGSEVNEMSRKIQPSCMQLLPYLMELKATSSGIRPSAQPLLDENSSISELEGLEMSELIDLSSQCRHHDVFSLSMPMSRPRRTHSRDKTIKQKVSSMQDLISTSASWSRMSIKKRRSINNSPLKAVESV